MYFTSTLSHSFLEYGYHIPSSMSCFYAAVYNCHVIIVQGYPRRPFPLSTDYS